jgi:hypothetical protein
MVTTHWMFVVSFALSVGHLTAPTPAWGGEKEREGERRADTGESRCKRDDSLKTKQLLTVVEAIQVLRDRRVHSRPSILHDDAVHCIGVEGV